MPVLKNDGISNRLPTQPTQGVYGGNDRVLFLELCRDQLFTTAGGAGYVAHLLVNAPPGLPPYIQDIVGHAYGRAFSSNFKYKVTGDKSYDGMDWTAFNTTVLTEQTSGGTKISSTPHSDRSDYGLHIRFRVEVNDTGSRESGVLSVVLAIRLWQ